MDLMIKMLKIDPRRRISPDDILNHPFCSSTAGALEYAFSFDEDEDFSNEAFHEVIHREASQFTSKTLIHSQLTLFVE